MSFNLMFGYDIKVVENIQGNKILSAMSTQNILKQTKFVGCVWGQNFNHLSEVYLSKIDDRQRKIHITLT